MWLPRSFTTTRISLAEQPRAGYPGRPQAAPRETATNQTKQQSSSSSASH